jgi:hypothetical protein
MSFFKRPAIRKIVLIWLAWAIILLGFQEIVTRRLDIVRPDYALEWTQNETLLGSQSDKPYLNDEFMNKQVCWDSEFYLSIAVTGYDDPQVRAIDGPLGNQVSLNYAFFPFYSMVMRVFMAPLALFKLTPIATATLAGILVSLLGALAGMLGLYDLTRDELGEDGGIRTAFYMLIFPTGFFLAQVYTEGLFVGLAFSAIALARRRQLIWAALLAALAVWTRAVGGALAIPLALGAWEVWKSAPKKDWKTWLSWLAPVVPVISYAVWNLSPLAGNFHFIEGHYFGKGMLMFGPSWGAWKYAFDSMLNNGPQPAMYYGLEFSIVALGLVTSLAMLRKYPPVALFSLVIWGVCMTSGAGSAQSVNRYVLTMPAVFIALSKLGKNEAFDRGWTLASTLIMGMLAMLFSFDMWVG